MFEKNDIKETIFTPKNLIEHKIFGSPTINLIGELSTVGELVVSQANDRTPVGLAKLARDQVSKRVVGPFREMTRAMPLAQDNLNGRRGDFFEPLFSESEPPIVRVELRQSVRGGKLHEVIDASRRNPSLRAAIIEGGLQLSGLPVDIFEMLAREMAVGNASRRLADQHGYRTKPTPLNPIGGLPDHDAAKAAAEALITALEVEGELLSSVPSTLASVVSATAMMMDVDRSAAFDLLTAA
jgi:hypothetical protein